MIATLEIAHYTGWSKDELFNWTADEIELALKHIEQKEKERWTKALMLEEYHILLTSEYNKKAGKSIVADTQAYKKAHKSANKIKEVLTGIVAEKTGGIQSSGLAPDVRVTEMTLEEYKKIKETSNL
jgi:hypothetical protein